MLGHGRIIKTYRKNLQGDVTHIYTADGALVAQYAYDAWGNCKTLVNVNGIAELNPFRYRSYYLDSETGLYYLQTRYYDPETGRFISADSIEYLDPKTLGGLNLYAYCGNNPVMAVDPEGTAWWHWLVFGAVAIVAVVLFVVGTIMTGGVLGIVGSMIAGAALGFLGASIGNIVYQAQATGWDFSQIDPLQALRQGGIGAAIGAITGFCSGVLGSLGEFIGNCFAYDLGSQVVAGRTISYMFEAFGGQEFITAMFSFLGGKIGEIIGGMIGLHEADQLFGISFDFEEGMKDTIKDVRDSWIMGFILRLIMGVRQ